MIGDDSSSWERLKGCVHSEVEKFTEQIADGLPGDEKAYRQHVGYRRALIWVLSEMKRITTAPERAEPEEPEEE